MGNEFFIIDNRENKKVDASIIIATYNHEWCVEYVIKALLNQSIDNFEILYADDGSKDKTHEIIKKYPVFLIYQENNGFRKTRIINEASKYVRSEYIILLDGDCIPHRDFVKAHIENKEKNTYLAGRRIDIPKDVSNKYLNLEKDFPIQKFLLQNFWRIEHLNRLLPIKNKFLRKLFKQDKIYDMMGCNGSFWYEDFLKVDGYDERFVKAHREDGDLCARFKNSGLKIKSVKGLALVYHLWHNKQTYYENEDIYYETISSKRKIAVKGLSSR